MIKSVRFAHPHRLAALAALLCVPLAPTPAPAPQGCHHGHETQFSRARIYWEYNATDDDLGVHVTLDGEDWKRLRIERPDGRSLFEVKGKGPYQQLGMTELFFEGAEPSLSEVPLSELLADFPEGTYEFEGRTVDNEEIGAAAEFSHAIPDGPDVSATVGGPTSVTIEWTEVTSPPPGFPQRPITIAGYQVIVESFQVTLPASARSVTVPPEFVGSLTAGVHQFEVLAIEQNGNQTLTVGEFSR
ncbi:MAG: hypothetical protein KDC98_15275 [Planctomycetes bacterium]|nr:hypothetical protein [Planctomycetota bacterium]